MNKMKNFLDDDQFNKIRTKSWAFSKEKEEIIDFDKSYFIQNYILPFYLLGEEIYVPNNLLNALLYFVLNTYSLLI